MTIINGVSTAFLDAYMKDSREAREFLAGTWMLAEKTERATLEVK